MIEVDNEKIVLKTRYCFFRRKEEGGRKVLEGKLCVDGNRFISARRTRQRNTENVSMTREISKKKK